MLSVLSSILLYLSHIHPSLPSLYPIHTVTQSIASFSTLLQLSYTPPPFPLTPSRHAQRNSLRPHSPFVVRPLELRYISMCSKKRSKILRKH